LKGERPKGKKGKLQVQVGKAILYWGRGKKKRGEGQVTSALTHCWAQGKKKKRRKEGERMSSRAKFWDVGKRTQRPKVLRGVGLKCWLTAG